MPSLCVFIFTATGKFHILHHRLFYRCHLLNSIYIPEMDVLLYDSCTFASAVMDFTYPRSISFSESGSNSPRCASSRRGVPGNRVSPPVPTSIGLQKAGHRSSRSPACLQYSLLLYGGRRHDAGMGLNRQHHFGGNRCADDVWLYAGKPSEGSLLRTGSLLSHFPPGGHPLCLAHVLIDSIPPYELLGRTVLSHDPVF